MPPVINLVRPASGWSAGSTLVQIDGAGFVVPPLAPSNVGPTAPPAPTMQVLFDGLPATQMQVVSSTILRCLTPRHPPTREVDGQQITNGIVDVEVRLLDANGDPIPGQSAIAIDAYEFVRPQLGSLEVQGAWYRVVDAMIEHWKNVLLENVAWNPSVDYDAETGDVRGYVELASLPGIAITKAAFPASISEPEHGPNALLQDGEAVLVRRAPIASDLTFTMTLVSRSSGELLNLAEALNTCFTDAADFEVLVDPEDPSKGTATFSMLLTQPPSLSDRIGNTDLMTAEATVMVARVLSMDLPGAPLEGLPGVDRSLPHQATRQIARPLDRIVLARQPKR